ncbi:hypothetical protein ABT160_43565 [Streptomyces sp. NPDC001941]|uniref:hypothetical protein n=1 Tax=Streptomyces sp. NPDC001941 TaxID=3154659 RepID=UPI00332BEE68
MGWRRENKAHDDARTGRLLDGVEAAYAARTGDPCGDQELTAFEEIALFASAPDPREPYPPAGHDYPRRGNGRR